MECQGKTIVELQDNISEKLKLKIFDVFSEEYSNSSYIDYIDEFNFEGDMGCLFVFGTSIVRHLKEKKLINYIKKYEVLNLITNKKEYLINER